LFKLNFLNQKRKELERNGRNNGRIFEHISCEDEIYKLADNSFMVSPRIYQMIKDKTK
jgi:hypothetical protein